MDRREVEFWLREAGRVRALEEMAMLSMMRLAMWADGSTFKKAFEQLEAELPGSAASRQEEVDANWAGLKSMRRG